MFALGTEKTTSNKNILVKFMTSYQINGSEYINGPN